MASIDLQNNYPILSGQREQLTRHVEAAMAESWKWVEGPPYGGYDEHREIGAEWLRRRSEVVSQDRLMIAAGGHNGVIASLLVAELRGKKIATDYLTYPGFKLQANLLGCSLVACDMDAEGTLPSAIARAAVEEQASAVYLMPNVHNPLGVVMPERRRLEICEVARRHGLVIIDDDAYGFCEANPPASFATLAPERSYFVHSFTKPYAPAMKLAFIVYPEGQSDAMTVALRSLSSGAPALFVDVAARLIESGEMTQLLDAKRGEALERQKLAAEAFAGLNTISHPSSFHVWIELSEEKSADKIASALQQDGVEVSPGSDYCATANVISNGMRIALGAERDLEKVHQGLLRVRKAIDEA